MNKKIKILIFYLMNIVNIYICGMDSATSLASTSSFFVPCALPKEISEARSPLPNKRQSLSNLAALVADGKKDSNENLSNIEESPKELKNSSDESSKNGSSNQPSDSPYGILPPPLIHENPSKVESQSSQSKSKISNSNMPVILEEKASLFSPSESSSISISTSSSSPSLTSPAKVSSSNSYYPSLTSTTIITTTSSSSSSSSNASTESLAKKALATDASMYYPLPPAMLQSPLSLPKKSSLSSSSNNNLKKIDNEILKRLEGKELKKNGLIFASDADRVMSKILKFISEQKSSDVIIEKGKKWILAGNFEEARELFKLAAHKFNDDNLYAFLGLIYHITQNNEKALNKYRYAFHLNSNNEISKMGIANILIDENKIKEANFYLEKINLKSLEEFVKNINPNDLLDLIILMGSPILEIFVKKFKTSLYIEEVANLANKMESKIEKDNLLGYWILARILDYLKLYDKAEEKFRTVINLNPYYLRAQIALSTLLFKTNKFQDAKERFKFSLVLLDLSLNPDKEEIRRNLTLLIKESVKSLEEQKKREENLEIDATIKEFHRLIDADFDFPLSHLNLANFLFSLSQSQAAEKKHKQDAEVEYKKAIELAKKRNLKGIDIVEFYTNFGIFLHISKRYEEAETQLRTALTAKASFVLARNVLGVVLQDQGLILWDQKKLVEAKDKFSDAEGQFKASLVYEPDNQKIKDNLNNLSKIKEKLHI